MDDFNARTRAGGRGKGKASTKISYQSGDGEVHHGEDAAVEAMEQDSEDMEQSAADSDKEIIEMV